MNIAKILEYALEREYEGKRFFSANAERLHHAAAVSAFKAIAEEEQRHIEFISAQLAALDAGVSAQLPELPRTGFFAERAESESIAQTLTESMVADLPVLRMAYLIERDFAEFYQSAAAQLATCNDSAESEAKKILDMLAKWEAGHERLFKHMHDELFEQYAEMPWGG